MIANRPARQCCVVGALIWLSGCSLESPLTPTSPSATLQSVVVACERLTAGPAGLPNAYCPATACFSDRTIRFITPDATWSTSVPAIATVEAGRVFNRGTGSVVISATYAWQGGAPVTGVHRMTITESGCVASDPQRPNLCDDGSGGTPGFSPPGTCF